MDFKFGIEEEFFVVSERTRRVQNQAHSRFISRASELAGDGVHPELLQSQIEAATPVCRTMQEARDHIIRLRSALAAAAGESGLAILAAGTHPTAEWSEQLQTEKRRYDNVVDELKILAMRNLVCGLHVHVEVPDNELRIDVMRRMMPYLPLLLGLSCSSPFWRGMATGFSSYRLTSYDELPRTGLPPLFSSWGEYSAYIHVLEEAGIIRDASFIWWAARPSHKYPTIELRIADACTSMEDTITIAALYRCIVRALLMDRTLNAHIGSPERALVKENKWRAQRYGLRAEIVDPFVERVSIDMPTAIRRLLDLLAPHALALDCVSEVERAAVILDRGTSADRQVGVYDEAIASGASHREALSKVKSWLQSETLVGCVSVPTRERELMRA